MKNTSITVGRIRLEGYKCERCGHEWFPRIHYKDKPPVLCPSCKSAYWDIPREKKSTTNKTTKLKEGGKTKK